MSTADTFSISIISSLFMDTNFPVFGTGNIKTPTYLFSNSNFLKVPVLNANSISSSSDCLNRPKLKHLEQRPPIILGFISMINISLFITLNSA